MKGGLRFIALTVAALAMLAGSAAAAGFGIYEWSGRGNAMGGAVVACPKDASTAAHNPAGAVDLPDTNFYAGVSGINPKAIIDMDAYDDAKGKSNVWMPPHAYVTHQLNDDWWFTGAVFSRFGLGTEFEEDWAGRYNCSMASIESLSFNPNLVYKINDEWSVGVGVEIMWLEFTQEKSVDRRLVYDPNTYDWDSDARLQGDSIGKGLTLSLYHKPLDWLSVGLVYRSQMKHKIRGDVWFRQQGTLAAVVPGAFSENQEATGILILPDSVTLGAAVKPLDDLTLEADVVWTRWSTYQELRIDYEKPLVPGVQSTDHSTSVKNWKDTFRYQFGAEYGLLDWLDVRASYIYDQSPIRDDHDDYMIPAADRQLYSCGLGFHWDNYLVDVAYTYLRSGEREYTFRGANVGVQNGQAHDLETHILGVSVGYKF